jgi:hypothetical protein
MVSVRTAPTRGQKIVRRCVPLLLVCGVVVVLLWIVIPGGHRAAQARHRSQGEAPSRPTVSAPSPTGSSSTTVPTSTTTTTNAGSLPQTGVVPSGDDPQFQTEMAALWAAIVHASSGAAATAFFPEGAYIQLKAVPNAASDFEGRLLTDFALDLMAAHGVLGTDASNATLVSVNVPKQFAHWVPPGTCDNGIGYFEVANSRIVYQEDGQIHSLGIASLISWRGEWYVVHLGAILRSTNTGVVLDPETGPGASPPSNTC